MLKYTNPNPDVAKFGYEIAHTHINDGSLHVVLHPEDVKTVIDSGWGERHPIARNSWYWQSYFNYWSEQTATRPRRPPVPKTHSFIYAPRTEAEMDVITEIIKAAIWWTTGVKSDFKRTDRMRRDFTLPAKIPDSLALEAGIPLDSAFNN